MNQIQTTFSDAEKVDEYLEHYGVKGMKWGVWNSETQRKYSGGLGRASNVMKSKMSSAAGNVARGAKGMTRFVGNKVSTKAKSAAAARATRIANKKEAAAARKANKKEAEAVRKELGMSKKKYDQLREKTLKAHDPRVVAKGMHTLTDAELNQKLDRLQREEKINKMATKLDENQAEARKKKYEAFNSNILVKAGKQYADKYVEGKINQLLNTKDVKKTVQKATEKAEKKEQKKEAKTTKVAYEKRDTTPLPKDDTVKVYENSTTQGYVNWNASKSLPGKVSSTKSGSSEAKKSAERGKSWIDDDIIDVTPTEYSSTRNHFGGRKK